jgi:hypothetical protein
MRAAMKTAPDGIAPARTKVELGPLLKDALASGNLKVLASFLGPAYRGFVKQEGKLHEASLVNAKNPANFDWIYQRDHPELARLYEAAKASQWNAATDLDWSTAVDPDNDERALLPEEYLVVAVLPLWRTLSKQEQSRQRLSTVAWLLSQFLHGEQGALFAAAQVTQSVPWMDGKLYGSSQVVDEGRHVEVFHRYLSTKLQKSYQINDNLFVVIDALMRDPRWDMKFLGMQIMVEGLALGAFGVIRQVTREPFLRQMLTYVIGDEARHVHYGVLALREYLSQVSERERREREDWAFEVSLFLRNRFLGHELYDEYYAPLMPRKEWDELVLGSLMMKEFRRMMFRRIIPNLKRIGLLSDRVRPRYAELGLLEYESGKAAPELEAKDLLEG